MLFSSQHWLLTVSRHVAAPSAITGQNQTGGVCHWSVYFWCDIYSWDITFQKNLWNQNKQIALKQSWGTFLLCYVTICGKLVHFSESEKLLYSNWCFFLILSQHWLLTVNMFATGTNSNYKTKPGRRYVPLISLFLMRCLWCGYYLSVEAKIKKIVLKQS